VKLGSEFGIGGKLEVIKWQLWWIYQISCTSQLHIHIM